MKKRNFIGFIITITLIAGTFPQGLKTVNASTDELQKIDIGGFTFETGADYRRGWFLDSTATLADIGITAEIIDTAKILRVEFTNEIDATNLLFDCYNGFGYSPYFGQADVAGLISQDKMSVEINL